MNFKVLHLFQFYGIFPRKNEITLLKFQEVPYFMKDNPFILNGYRPPLSLKKCLKSMFMWSNETVNIWSHLVSSFIFFYFFLKHTIKWALRYIDDNPSDTTILPIDNFVVCMALFCFLMCLVFSTCYHTFRCHSAKVYDMWLNMDYFGISCGAIGCIIPGIHFAFYCFKDWHYMYMFFMVVLMFSLFSWHAYLNTNILLKYNNTTINIINIFSNNKYYAKSIEKKNEVDEMKNEMPIKNTQRNCGFCSSAVLFYFLLSATTLLPLLHWAYLNSSFNSSFVIELVIKTFVSYIVLATSCVIFMFKFPERFFPGRFDYIGASHQIWHLLISLNFLWWYHTGIRLISFINHSSCFHQAI